MGGGLVSTVGPQGQSAAAVDRVREVGRTRRPDITPEIANERMRDYASAALARES